MTSPSHVLKYLAVPPDQPSADGARCATEPGRATLVRRQLPKASGRVPAWASRLVFLLGLVNMASAVFPRRRSLLDWPIDLGPPLGTAMRSILGIAVGFGLLIMARGLRHRKRAAWRAVVGLLSVGTILHLIKGIDPVQTVVSAAVTVVLLISKDQFVGRGDPRDRRAVPTVLVSMTLACWLLGCLITQADRDGLVPGWTWPDLILHAGVGMIGVAGPMRFVSQAATVHNSVMLLGLGVITVATTLLALLSSSTTAEPATAEDRRRVRSLLETHGQTDSLGYFATRNDKSVTRGWSLDVMRRGPGLDNGVMEIMIADVVEAARERGIRQISLNFALFRSSLARGERIGAGPILRAWVRLLLFASRWWQIASLYRANAKLCPSWNPRFLCFASARDLGDIVLASVQAEGFLTLPRLPQARRRQAGAARAGAAR